ncbi:MAG: UDP-N-acetylmuramoyl-tripeptide--D-alanyl-D-alanine ligase [Planctomycetota bacterium]|nr:UDP-N-acetylmuramoyl-tripeptide--D-alanyl-D-alanine ligase [Planctomycetota bacterium]
MKSGSLREVARWAGAELVRGTPSLQIQKVVFDSREATAGSLFVALDGAQRHGIQFAADALKRGAAAVLCGPGDSQRHEGPSIEAPVVLTALSALARGYRQQDRDQTPALAVTGSVGKTTTCGMIHDLLSASYQVHAPRRSFNNEIGVPITILEAPPETEVLVLELGTSSPGEIAARTEVAQPTHGVITAISEAHLEGLGSLEGVRQEKFSLLERLSGDQRWAPIGWRDRAGEQASLFHWTGPDGDLEVRRHPSDGVKAIDRLRGREYILPWDPPADWAMRCFESALAVVLDLVSDPEVLVESVKRMSLPPLRHEIRRAGAVELILDCYNSSPYALKCAIEDLSDSSARRKVAVIGTMEELGNKEQQLHIEAGQLCARSKIELIFVCGRAAEWYAEGLAAHSNRCEVVRIEKGDRGVTQVCQRLESGDSVLFKASRKEALEQFASAVEQELLSLQREES